MGSAEKIIKVMYFSSFGSFMRGGQISLWNLLKRLDRPRFRPYLIVPEEGELTRCAAGAGVDYRLLNVPPIRPGHFKEAARAFKKIRRIIIENGTEIVHADDLRFVIYAGILKPFLGYKIVWHIRVSWRNGPLDILGYLFSDSLICTARMISERFKKLPGSKRKVCVIYNAVDCAHYRPEKGNGALARSLGLGENELLIGFLARLDPVKGLQRLINAMVCIRMRLANVRLMIAGSGDKRYIRDMERAAEELNLGESVVFLGYREDPRDFLNLIDISVLPTTEYEGSSRSIIEAMACGVPVIATDSGGNRELVQDGITGVLLSSPSEDLICKACVELLSNEKRRERMGEAARAAAAENFDIDENVGRTEELYGELTGGVRK